ncbi:MAG: hypothetical protein RL030_1610, partial [Pseudomonadota bacterium]
MLKASLQLRLGQQLTMTPQLQQAIRLLQLPSLELQAHIRELLESNVMLEAEEDNESTASFESLGAGPGDREPEGEEGPPASASEQENEPTVEIVDDSWNESSTSSSPADTPWNGDEEDRQQDYQDARGQSLQQHLSWQLELAHLDPRELAIGRALVDAISDDGYLTESPEIIATTLRPEIEATPQEIAHML